MPDVHTLVSAIAKSNGTVVPNSLVLASYARKRTTHSSRIESRFHPVFCASRRGSNGFDASFQRLVCLRNALTHFPESP